MGSFVTNAKLVRIYIYIYIDVLLMLQLRIVRPLGRRGYKGLFSIHIIFWIWNESGKLYSEWNIHVFQTRSWLLCIPLRLCYSFIL